MPDAPPQIWTYTTADLGIALLWAAIWTTLACAAQWRVPGLFAHMLPRSGMPFANQRWARGGVLAGVLCASLFAIAAGLMSIPGRSVPLALQLIGGAVAPALGEELFFRGALLQALAQRLPPAVAIVLSSICFAVVHPGWPTLVFAAAFGMALAMIVWRTQRLGIAIGIHFAFNASIIVIGGSIPAAGV